jgi:hypothetical protein
VLKNLLMTRRDRHSLVPRLWSNEELRRIAPLFTGDILNVSAWKDGDREGGHYKDYFSSASSYTISNWRSSHGYQGNDSEIIINLEESIPEVYNRKFDAVFNHTTLEHIFDVFRAFNNLCELSRDVVIVVVPFMQFLHWKEGYLDYWRFTPYALRALFERSGLRCVYESVFDRPNHSVYVLSVGSRHPEKWMEKLSYTPHDWLRVGKGNVRNDLLAVLSEKIYALLKRV